mgnify:CR=1 FL=1
MHVLSISVKYYPHSSGRAVSESAGNCNQNKWGELRAGLSPCEGEGTADTA